MSKPLNILLVRHGQSHGNINKEIYKSIPDYALELTEQGQQQALEAGKKIWCYFADQNGGYIDTDPVQFYISPFWRTRQTYQLIKRSFSKSYMYEDPRLREQEWNGKLPTDGYRHEDEAERDSYGHFYYRFDGGESCGDVFDRVSDFMNTLHRDFERDKYPKNVIIVTHGMTMRVFLMRWLHLKVEEFEQLANPKNCEFIALKLNCFEKYDLVTDLRQYSSINHPYQYDWNKLA